MNTDLLSMVSCKLNNKAHLNIVYDNETRPRHNSLKDSRLKKCLQNISYRKQHRQLHPISVNDS